MARIDKEQALKMMQSGNTDSQIAICFGTSRQAVNLLRKSLIKTGKFDTHSIASQVDLNKQVLSQIDSKNQPENKQVISPPTEPIRKNDVQVYPSFEQINDWMIKIIKDAGETRQLRLRCELAEIQVKTFQEEIDRLKQELQELTDKLSGNLARANEYQEVIRKLELPPTAST
jgi:hypothetical protein